MAFYGITTCGPFRVPTAANSQGKIAKCGLQAVRFLHKRNTTERNCSSDIQMSLAVLSDPRKHRVVVYMSASCTRFTIYEEKQHPCLPEM